MTDSTAFDIPEGCEGMNIEITELGVIIINTDGSLSKIPNWHELTDGERQERADSPAPEGTSKTEDKQEEGAAQRLVLVKAQAHAIRGLPGADAELARLDKLGAALEKEVRASRPLPRRLQSAQDTAAGRREAANAIRRTAH